LKISVFGVFGARWKIDLFNESVDGDEEIEDTDNEIALKRCGDEQRQSRDFCWDGEKFEGLLGVSRGEAEAGIDLDEAGPVSHHIVAIIQNRV
jgi:hypothetical protein